MEIVIPSGETIEVLLVQVQSAKQARIAIKCNRDFKINRKDELSGPDEE